MLFNTPEYFLLFLPVSIIVYFFFSKRRYFAASKLWLLLCSLFFYCYWKFDYIWILLGSIVFNFVVGFILSKEANGRQNALENSQNTQLNVTKKKGCLSLWSACKCCNAWLLQIYRFYNLRFESAFRYIL